MVERLDEVGRTVSEQKLALDRKVAGLSSDIAGHDRTQDVYKALERPLLMVEKIRTILQ